MSTQLETKAYPIDPIANIPWSGGFSGVNDIDSAFNTARSIENNQLGIYIPMLSFPSQEEWDSMNDGEKALWLINQERIDRGIDPLHGIETHVTSVAQYYAQFLLENNAWGHRHAVLWFPYNDNSGTPGMEGFLGIGRANGGPYQGPFNSPWNYAEIIVMNVFDPFSTWDYGAPPEIPASISYPFNDPDGSFTVSWSAVSEASGYQLERTTNPSFSSAITCYTGPSTSYSESGLINGTYYY